MDLSPILLTSSIRQKSLCLSVCRYVLCLPISVGPLITFQCFSSLGSRSSSVRRPCYFGPLPSFLRQPLGLSLSTTLGLSTLTEKREAKKGTNNPKDRQPRTLLSLRPPSLVVVPVVWSLPLSTAVPPPRRGTVSLLTQSPPREAGMARRDRENPKSLGPS